MTIDEFIERLRETPRGRWYVSKHGFIRRGACCPITVMDTLTSPARTVDFVRTLLELSIEDTRDIVDAADMNDDHDPALRARILEAVGLEAPAE